MPWVSSRAGSPCPQQDGQPEGEMTPPSRVVPPGGPFAQQQMLSSTVISGSVPSSARSRWPPGLGRVIAERSGSAPCRAGPAPPAGGNRPAAWHDPARPDGPETGVSTRGRHHQRDQARAAGESTPTASLLTMPLPAQMAMQEKGKQERRCASRYPEKGAGISREYREANRISKRSDAGATMLRQPG